MNSKSPDLARSARWAQTYETYSAWLSRIESSPDMRVISDRLGYSAPVIRRRLMQRLAETQLSPFLRESAKLYDQGLSTFGDSKGTRPALGLFCRSVVRFFIQWAKALLAVILPNNRALQEAATLLFGMPAAILAEPQMSDFLLFCIQGPITPLRNPQRLWIQGQSKHPSEGPQICKQPLLALSRAHVSGLQQKIRFVAQHVRALGAYLAAVFQCPLVCLLVEDFAHHAVAQHLNASQTLKNVLITNSNYADQVLWMTDLQGRHFETHMVWYSTNSRLFSFQHLASSEVFPPYRYMHADHHWVWNQGQGEALKRLQPDTQIRVVGPILWYMPPTVSPKKSARSPALQIGVFDVSPVTRQWEKAFGLVFNYYQTSIMISFIDDIVMSSEEISQRHHTPVSIQIKHKRAHQPLHDSSYIRHIAQLEQDHRLQVAPFDSNLFQFIAQCDAIIVIPYSSPAYIASALGIPSIYYDPCDLLRSSLDPAPLIQFAAGKQELARILEETVSQKLRHFQGENQCV